MKTFALKKNPSVAIPIIASLGGFHSLTIGINTIVRRVKKYQPSEHGTLNGRLVMNTERAFAA